MATKFRISPDTLQFERITSASHKTTYLAIYDEKLELAVGYASL